MKTQNNLLTAMYFLWQQVTDWYTLRERVFTIGAAFFFKINTPWKAKFDRIIKSVAQAGIYKHWIKVRCRDERTCDNNLCV